MFICWLDIISGYFGNRKWIWLEVVGFGCLIYLQIFLLRAVYVPLPRRFRMVYLHAFRQNDEKHFVVLCVAFSWF